MTPLVIENSKVLKVPKSKGGNF